MLVLYETPAGYALFKVLKEKKLAAVGDIASYFEDPTKASGFVKLKAFHKFNDTTQAVAAAAAMIEGSLDDPLKKFLKKNIVKKELTDELGVLDSKLGNVIKEKLGISCVNTPAILQLARGIRSQLSSLVDGLDDSRINAMVLGLGHSLSRYKLKFSPDKVDTMVVQAIGLLDDLDKEINTYAMRVKEWYGWHFPEMAKIVADNLQYAQAILKMGVRSNAAKMDFSDIMDESVEVAMKESAIVSMGTDVSETDLISIKNLATQVVALMEYRRTLSEYLTNRMNAIAPNLTVMVGELVGARLIAHAGSLMNLAKQPASTVQILGAEKALFRALKTKHETPKYGLIFHASLIGQAGPKNKGKIARVLAAKTALAIRVDALGEGEVPTVGLEGRAKVEARLRTLEGGVVAASAGTAKARSRTAPASGAAAPAPAATYNPAGDLTVGNGAGASAKADKKAKKEKKEKKAKKSKKADSPVAAAASPVKEKKSKKEKKEKKEKKRKAEAAAAEESPEKTEKKSKKEKKAKKARTE